MSLELPSKWPGLVATAKAEKQEPDDLTIAYMSGLHDGKKKRTWVGLTHEEHMEIMTGSMTTSSRMAAVEAKLRDKNNG